MSKEKLHRCLLKCNIIFSSRKNHYEHQSERPEIVAMWANYLARIKEYRGQGYVIFNHDETWVLWIMAQSKVWSFEGDDPLCKVPSGTGDCSIVSRLSSAKTGLLEGCLLLFRGKESNKGADYNMEMCAAVFMD